MKDQKLDRGFLPEGYEAPTGGNLYMKFKNGENRIRILSRPIIGWLDWKDKKPVRFGMKFKPEKPFDTSKPVKHFWAFLVYDVSDPGIKILEITQSSIQMAIANLSKDSDWGTPFDYDIKINKTGQDLDTEYSVLAAPKKELSDDIKAMSLASRANLDRLFTNEDPWEKGQAKYTDLGFEGLPF